MPMTASLGLSRARNRKRKGLIMMTSKLLALLSWIFQERPALRSQSAACLSVVTILTKRLPVLLIPEQFFITPVRYDMIDYCCRGDSVFRETLCAQRMLPEETLSGLAPSGIITSDSSAASKRVLRPVLPMFLTKDALLAEIGTAGVSAWAFG